MGLIKPRYMIAIFGRLSPRHNYGSIDVEQPFADKASAERFARAISRYLPTTDPGELTLAWVCVYTYAVSERASIMGHGPSGLLPILRPGRRRGQTPRDPAGVLRGTTRGAGGGAAVKVDRAKLRALVHVEVHTEPEDDQIEGFAAATDNPEEDRKLCALIRDEIARGNEWAWCVVGTEVEYLGYQVASYVGMTSYLWAYNPNPEAAWRADNYEQELTSAVEALALRLESMTDRDAALASIASIEAELVAIADKPEPVLVVEYDIEGLSEPEIETLTCAALAQGEDLDIAARVTYRIPLKVQS